MKKRILSIALSVVMLVSLLPTVALASTTGHEGHYATACNGSCGHVDGDPHKTVEMVAWTDNLAEQQNGTGATAATSLPKTAGSYYLTADVSISSTWEPATGTNLCLNGKTIKMTAEVDAIKVNSGMTFTLTDCDTTGKITHTAGVKGHGVKVSGTFNMYGGSISGNTVNGTHGPGVNVDCGTFNMYGGTISGNSDIGGSGKGGGVYVIGGTFDMTGGTITENTANNGGGVCIYSGTFNISGNPEITGNKNSSGNTTEDIYLGQDANPIVIVGALTNSESISIRKHNYTGDFAVPGDGVTLTAADAAKFTSSNASYNVVLSDGKLTLVNPASHPICGVTCTHDTDSEQEGVQAEHVNITWTAWTSTTTLPIASGYYYLTADVVRTSTWTPANGTFLCLNGYSITMDTTEESKNIPVITVQNGATLTLTDCNTGTNKVTHADGKYGVGVAVASGGTFNMYGGVISGNTTYDITPILEDARANGSGVRNAGTFNMYGGEISNNTTVRDNGGGVCNESGATFNMYGGKICNNGFTYHGQGGGVYNNGTFNMSGGEIHDNTAKNASSPYDKMGGGGVYNGGIFNMSGGEIRNNIASKREDVSTYGYGGGVYLYDGTFNISGNPVITGNTRDGSANNVYLPEGKVITVNGALTNGAAIKITMKTDGVFTSGWSTAMTGNVNAYGTYFGADDNTKSVFLVGGEVKLGIPTYTVTFDANGHGTAPTAIADVTSGNKISAPTAPEASGWIFGGWYEEAECTNEWNFSTDTVTGNITLYAKWEKVLHEHPICGATCGHSTTHENKQWTPIGTKEELRAINEAGYYYLTASVELGYDYWEPVNGVVLDLCGNTLSGSTTSLISLKTDVEFTVTDCMGTGKISHSCSYQCSTIQTANGTSGAVFNLYNGAVKSTGYVYNDQRGNVFNQYGGALTSSANQLHAVFVRSGGKYNLYGGSVTSNYIAVCVMDENTQLTMSGDVEISAPIGIQVSNPIKIAGALDEPSAPYTIYTSDLSGYLSYFVFTEDWNRYMQTVDPTDYFAATTYSSDRVVAKVNGELQLVAHTHGSWTYSYADGTITATCGVADCTLQSGVTATVVVDNSNTYDGIARRPVSVNYSSDWSNAEAGTVTITGEEILVGTGSATLSIGNLTGDSSIPVEFTIGKADPRPENFTVTLPTNLTYDGTAKVATVTENRGNLNSNKIIVGYAPQGTTLAEPIDAQAYAVVIIGFEENDYYNNPTEYMFLAHGSFIISQKDISQSDVTVETIPDQNYTGSAIKPALTVKYTVSENNVITLEKGRDYTVDYGENTNIGENAGSVTITGIGNYTGTKTVNFTITYAAKTAQEAFGYIYDADVWVKEAPTFTPASGYVVSTEANGTYGSSSITFEDEGLGVTKTVYVKDGSGNIYSVELKYNLDKTTPVISAVSGNPDSWTKENATVSFTAEDALSGIASVVVTCDDGQTVIYSNNSFTADRNGTYTITVTDKAGNKVTETVTVTKIDNTAPSLRIDVPTGTDGNDGWFTSAVTVPVTAGDGDGESGLDKWYYSLNGGTDWTDGSNGSFVISDDGDYNQTVKIKAVDNVGNETVTTIARIKIDTTAPGSVTVSTKVGDETYTSGEWTTGNVVFTLTGGTDTTSGFAKYQVKIGNADWADITDNTYTHTASTDESGVTYQFRAVDNAGNTGEASDSITVKKRQPYTIAFNANGGTGTMADQTAYRNTAAELTVNAFTRTGYTFKEWNTADDGSGTAYADQASVTNLAAMNETATLYAQWTPNTYKVKFDANDGTGEMADQSFTYDVEQNLTVNAFTKTGYTFSGWNTADDGSGTAYADEAAVKNLTDTNNGEVILYAQWMANTYKVKFDANDGTGEMADQSFTYDEAAKALTTNAYTREGYKFVGWAESADATGVDYVDKQSVSNLTAAPNGQFTLYAVWTRDIILSGTIVAPNVIDAENLELVLVGLDGTEYPVSVTGTESPYHYTVTVPEGEYQFVIKDTENSVTVTAKEELSEDKTEEPITMPTGNVNSIVDSTAAGDYAPIVGGLDGVAGAVANANPDADVTVTLTMTHEPANEEDTEHDALMDAAGTQKGKLTFFEIDIVKNVDGTAEAITDTTTPIEIVIPFDTTRKQNFKVYRFHDDNGNDTVDEGEVDILTTEANDAGEYIEVGTGSITIHAKFFSLYAIGYTDVIPYYPAAHSCTSKCEVCGGCEDAACTENACKDKCRLFGMHFTDVTDGKWYTESVEYVYHHKMMEGVGNNIFDINGTTTRAMIVTILWRLEGEPVVNSASVFNDVENGQWYSDAIAWANMKGIVEGYNGNFDPMSEITREQFATILWRYAKYKGYDVSVGEDTNILSYNDAFSVSEWAIPAMQWACGAGLMQGDGVNLTPKADATRAQAAALFQRFCENVAEK